MSNQSGEQPRLVTCPCQNCNGKIEFDANDLNGQEMATVECPHCKMETIIFAPRTPPPPPRLPSEISKPKKPSKLKAIGWFISRPYAILVLIFVSFLVIVSYINDQNQTNTSETIKSQPPNRILWCTHTVRPDLTGDPGILLQFFVKNEGDAVLRHVDLHISFYDDRGKELGSTSGGIDLYDHTLAGERVSGFAAHGAGPCEIFISHDKLGFNPHLIDRATVEVLR